MVTSQVTSTGCLYKMQCLRGMIIPGIDIQLLHNVAVHVAGCTTLPSRLSFPHSRHAAPVAQFGTQQLPQDQARRAQAAPTWQREGAKAFSLPNMRPYIYCWEPALYFSTSHGPERDSEWITLQHSLINQCYQYHQFTGSWLPKSLLPLTARISLKRVSQN